MMDPEQENDLMEQDPFRFHAMVMFNQLLDEISELDPQLDHEEQLRQVKQLVDGVDREIRSAVVDHLMEQRHTTFADQLGKTPSLLGVLLSVKVIPDEPSLLKTTLSILTAIELNLPGRLDRNIEMRFLLDGIINVLEGPVKLKFIKGLGHAALRAHYKPESSPISYQNISHCVVRALLLEDGRLADFDAAKMELLILVAAPQLQSVVATVWALLSENRSTQQSVLMRLQECLSARYGMTTFSQPILCDLLHTIPLLKKKSQWVEGNQAHSAEALDFMLRDIEDAEDQDWLKEIHLRFINIVWKLRGRDDKINAETFESDFELCPQFSDKSLMVTPGFLARTSPASPTARKRSALPLPEDPANKKARSPNLWRAREEETSEDENDDVPLEAAEPLVDMEYEEIVEQFKSLPTSTPIKFQADLMRRSIDLKRSVAETLQTRALALTKEAESLEREWIELQRQAEEEDINMVISTPEPAEPRNHQSYGEENVVLPNSHHEFVDMDLEDTLPVQEQQPTPDQEQHEQMPPLVEYHDSDHEEDSVQQPSPDADGVQALHQQSPPTSPEAHPLPESDNEDDNEDEDDDDKEHQPPLPPLVGVQLAPLQVALVAPPPPVMVLLPPAAVLPPPPAAVLVPPPHVPAVAPAPHPPAAVQAPLPAAVVIQPQVPAVAPAPHPPAVVAPNRLALRRLAQPGWQALLEPVPAEGETGTGFRQRSRRAAAQVSRAKSRYVAYAYRPNLSS